MGQSDLDELLIHRDEINAKLQKIIDEQTEPWGIKVSIVEVKDVELPDSLKRAMAAQAEAEREKRAKIIPPKASTSPRSSSGRPRTSSGRNRPRFNCATCKLCRDRRREKLDHHLPGSGRAIASAVHVDREVAPR